MGFMVTGEVVSNRVLNKVAAVVTEVNVEVPANNIAIYAGDSVPLYRQVEIVTGWKFLWGVIRDENVLDAQFVGAILYAGTNINSKGEADRRIASDVAFYDAEDIVVGVGVNVTTEFHGAVTPLDSAFEQLIQVAREHILFKAA